MDSVCLVCSAYVYYCLIIKKTNTFLILTFQQENYTYTKSNKCCYCFQCKLQIHVLYNTANIFFTVLKETVFPQPAYSARSRDLNRLDSSQGGYL